MTTHSYNGHKTEIPLIDLQTAIHYPLALPLQACYEKLGYKQKDFPVSARIQERVLSLPMYADLNFISQTIKQELPA